MKNLPNTTATSLDIAVSTENTTIDNSSTKLPFPLPYPPYSKMALQAEQKILTVRAQLVRESARFYLGIKHDLSKSYDDICIHLINRFPDLKDAMVQKGCNGVIM